MKSSGDSVCEVLEGKCGIVFVECVTGVSREVCGGDVCGG